MLSDTEERQVQSASNAYPRRPLRVIIGEMRPSDWVVLTEITLRLALYFVVHRFLTLPRLIALFDARPGRRYLTPNIGPQRLVWLLSGVLRNTLKRDYCMKRALILFHYLRRWNYAPTICFGVRKAEKDLRGHAWVEIRGIPVAEEGPDPRRIFHVTYAYPPK